MKKTILIIAAMTLISFAKTGDKILSGTLKSYNSKTKTAILEVRFPITVQNTKIQDVSGNNIQLKSLIGKKVTILYTKTKDYQRIASDIKQNAFKSPKIKAISKSESVKKPPIKTQPAFHKKKGEYSIKSTDKSPPSNTKTKVSKKKPQKRSITKSTSLLMKRTFSPSRQGNNSLKKLKSKAGVETKKGSSKKPMRQKPLPAGESGSLYKVVPAAPNPDNKQAPAG